MSIAPSAIIRVIDSRTPGELTRRARVTVDSAPRLDPDDPFCWGVVPG